MKYPLGNLEYRPRGIVIVILVVLTLSTMIGLQWTGRHLINAEARFGIVSFELAGNERASQAILNSWDQRTSIYAAFNLGLDFLFLFLYPATIALVVLWLVNYLDIGAIPTKMAHFVASSMVMAGILDALENGALLIMLVNSVESPLPQIAFVSAIIKFILIGISFSTITVLFINLVIRQLR